MSAADPVEVAGQVAKQAAGQAGLAGLLRRNLGLIVKLGVSALTLVLVARSVSLDTVGKLLAGADLRWMLVALLSFWLAQLASALRYVYISRTLGSPVAFWLSARLHFIGLWFNQVFPTSLGGDVVKVLLLKPVMGLGQAFRTTVLDRASGLIFLLVSIVVLLPLYFRVLPEPKQVWLLGLFAAAALTAIAVIACLAVPLATYVARIPAVRDILGVFESLMAFHRGKPLFEQTWTSAIVHVNGIVSYALAGKALGLPVSMLDYFLITPLVFLIALLPISFAGWGIRELGSVWLFGLVGLAAEQSSAMSVLFGLMLLAAGIPGLFMLPSGLSWSAHAKAARTAEGK